MLWIKALHIIAVVCWFAALFYLPRLFVYHTQALQQGDTQGSQRFEIMERKLYRGIMLPSMIAVVTLGFVALKLNYDYYISQHWMHAKLLLVTLLVMYHFVCNHYRNQLAANNCRKSERFFRVFNEVPVLFLLVIVMLVVVRPF